MFRETWRRPSVHTILRWYGRLKANEAEVVRLYDERLYRLYLANFASFEAQGGDANLGAAALFILWVYYTAIVFLLGAVVAETWELRKMQQRQRATLG